MQRPEKRPGPLADQREKTKRGMRLIMQREGLENSYRVAQFLERNGLALHKRAIDHYSAGTRIPSTQALRVLWKAFAQEEFNPATFGPTRDAPVAARLSRAQRRAAPKQRSNLERQVEIIHTVVREFMASRGLTTAHALRTSVGLSGSTSEQLVRNPRFLPGQVSLDRLRRVSNDPRLDPDVLGPLETVTYHAKRHLQAARPHTPSAGKTGTLHVRVLEGARSIPVPVTEKDFRPIHYRPRQADMDEMLLLIHELYRRFLLFSMVDDREIRSQIQNQLGPSVDELFLGLQIFEERHPTQIVRMMDMQRAMFRDRMRSQRERKVEEPDEER